jgi:hypothetical protein
MAKIPYFSAEMVIGDQPPMLASPTLRFHSKSALFYKEALWNRLETVIPEQYTKICFLDSDIVFDRPDWLDAISELLDTYSLVHPFTTMHYLDLEYKITFSRLSHYIQNNTSAVGFGLAIQRSILRSILCYFDKPILGRGDSI